MEKTIMKQFVLLLALMVAVSTLPGRAQVDPKTQMYRDEPKGDYQYQRKGVMDGNRVRTVYFNTTEVAHWPDGIGGEWPKGTGHNYIDGLTVLVGAKITLPNRRPATPIEAHYREEFDYDPVLGQQYPWDLEPVPGYINPTLALIPKLQEHQYSLDWHTDRTPLDGLGRYPALLDTQTLRCTGYHEAFPQLLLTAAPLHDPAADVVKLRAEARAYEVLHELGHLAGLEHCRDGGCLMSFAGSIERVDSRGSRFCASCATGLPRWLRGLPPDAGEA